MVKTLNKCLDVDKFIKPTSIIHDKQIIDQWADMYYALESGFTDNNLAYANLCLYRFLTFFLCPPEQNHQVQKENPISESIAYMKSNIDKLLTVDELAKQMNYSSSHYTSVFKNETKLSPIGYFIKLKVHHACQLLSQTELRINEISNFLGYELFLFFKTV